MPCVCKNKIPNTPASRISVYAFIGFSIRRSTLVCLAPIILHIQHSFVCVWWKSSSIHAAGGINTHTLWEFWAAAKAFYVCVLRERDMSASAGAQTQVKHTRIPASEPKSLSKLICNFFTPRWRDESNFTNCLHSPAIAKKAWLIKKNSSRCTCVRHYWNSRNFYE